MVMFLLRLCPTKSLAPIGRLVGFSGGSERKANAQFGSSQAAYWTSEMIVVLRTTGSSFVVAQGIATAEPGGPSVTWKEILHIGCQTGDLKGGNNTQRSRSVKGLPTCWAGLPGV